MWVLVVEDDPFLGRALSRGLQDENHNVTVARDGIEALSAIQISPFDAIILDVMMPAMNGIELTRRLRKSGNQTPILMLTARDAAAEIIEGLDVGADDYLVKPLDLQVLIGRLRAISRRASNPQVAILQVDDLTLDPASRAVVCGGQEVKLTATEFRLLEYLMRRPGRAASRSSIIEAVWGFEQDVSSNAVDVYIKQLRDKIDSSREHKLLHTVRGYGYVLRD